MTALLPSLNMRTFYKISHGEKWDFWNWCKFFYEFTVLSTHKKQILNDQDKKIVEIAKQGHFLSGCKTVSHLEQQCTEYKSCINLNSRNSTNFGIHLENLLQDTSFLSRHHHLLISRKNNINNKSKQTKPKQTTEILLRMKANIHDWIKINCHKHVPVLPEKSHWMFLASPP